MQFQDKVAVVTSGARGIGRCICGEFEKQGAAAQSCAAGCACAHQVLAEGTWSRWAP